MQNHTGILTQAEVAHAKPTSRAKVRRIIEDAVKTHFNDKLITVNKRISEATHHGTSSYSLAVGTATVQVDDSDAAIMRVSITYDHAQRPSREESDAIQNALCSATSVQNVGPLACYFEATGGQTIGGRFEFTFAVKVSA